MHNVTIATLIEYISGFSIIFFICFVGALTRDTLDTISNLTHISIKKILVSAIFSSVLLAAIFDMVSLNSMAICVFVCFFVGLWSFDILKVAMNWKVVKTILKHVLKNSKDIIGKSIADSITEIDDDTSKKHSTNVDDKVTHKEDK